MSEPRQLLLNGLGVLQVLERARLHIDVAWTRNRHLLNRIPRGGRVVGYRVHRGVDWV